MATTFLVSSVVHEAVQFVAMRWTCWPFNTFSLMFAAALISVWDWLFPVRSTISDGEGAEQISLPGKNPAAVLPASPSTETTAAASASSSTLGAPGVATALKDDSPTEQSSKEVLDSIGGACADGASSCVPESGGGGAVAFKIKKAGREWRGWGAVAFFEGAAFVVGLAVDFLAWQWWRETLMEAVDEDA